MDMWTYDPADMTKVMTSDKKAIVHKGGNQEETIWQDDNEQGKMKYFQEGVSNWKKVFNDWDGGVYGSLVLGSRTWLEDEDSAIDADGGWRRKNLRSLLKMREGDKEAPVVGKDKDDTHNEGRDSSDGEKFYCYNSISDEGGAMQDNSH